MSKVLCVTAHMDDEVLGVGGTLARHVKMGDMVQLICVCWNSYRKMLPDNGFAQFVESCSRLDLTIYDCLRFDDQLLNDSMLLNVENAIREQMKFEPTLIYTHWHQDLNRDHRLVSEAVQLIARPNRPGRKFSVCEFPTPSSTEYGWAGFQPNTWMDIKNTLDAKVKAMEAYKTDVQSYPLPRHPQMLRMIAAANGSQVGLESAEVFNLTRMVI